MTDSSTGQETRIGADEALQLQAAVLSQSRLEEAASTFATRLAQLFDLDHVYVGFMAEDHSRIVAVSHGAAVDTRQAQSREIADAMDEAIDQAATVLYPAEPMRLPRITLAHARLANRSGAAVCSIPLATLGSVVGAVTLVRSGGRPWSDFKLQRCEDILALVGPVLALKRENELPWSVRARRALRALRGRLTGPGDVRFKAVTAGVLLLCVAGTLVPVPYSVSAPARLEGAVQRAVVAPADGFLQQLSVRPGDQVREGQVLAELAQQDLLLERSKWESELAQQTNGYGAALARADRSLLMVNHAKVAEARAQLELIEKQIERAELKAPFDGIVISGDLSQSLGAPVQRGAVLMMVAPRDRYRLIVEVDERDIADVRPGAPGRITLAALPGQTFSFRTERIVPLAVTREGRNLFEVQGELEGAAPGLRPGLKGLARIDGGHRTLAWNVFHRLFDWLRLGLWSWGLLP